MDLLQKLGPGTKSPRPLTKNFPNSYGDILSDIMFIVYVCEGTDFPYTFHLVQFTVSPGFTKDSKKFYSYYPWVLPYSPATTTAHSMYSNILDVIIFYKSYGRPDK